MNKSKITFAITGAAGKIAVCFYGHLLSGSLFGPDVKINLRLLEVAEKMP